MIRVLSADRVGSAGRRAMIAAVCVGCLSVALGSGKSEPHARLLQAISDWESSYGTVLVGDGGKSIGPFHIQRAYWQDAVEHDPSIGGEYQDVYDDEYARKIVLAYWDRHGPDRATNEQLARIHNGGPRGHKKRSTIAYWREVSRILREGGAK
jgi:hypothetical protein